MRHPPKAFLLLAAAISVSACLGMCSIGAASGASLWPQRTSAIDDLLSVDEAFALVSVERKGAVVEVTWSIAPGYYLYRNRLSFAADPASAEHIFGSPRLPAAMSIHDERGNSEIYRNNLIAVLPLRDAEVRLRRLRVRYQGCADAGVCYPPQDKLINIVPGTAHNSKS